MEKHQVEASRGRWIMKECRNTYILVAMEHKPWGASALKLAGLSFSTEVLGCAFHPHISGFWRVRSLFPPKGTLLPGVQRESHFIIFYSSYLDTLGFFFSGTNRQEEELPLGKVADCDQQWGQCCREERHDIPVILLGCLLYLVQLGW